MRILVIGDPHGDLKKIKRTPIKEVDLILVTGDLGKADLMRKMAFENIERTRKGLPEKEYSAREIKRAFIQAYNSTIKIIRHLSRFAPVYAVFGNVESSNSEVKKLSRLIKLKLPLLEKSLKRMKNVKLINNKIVNFSGLRIAGLKYFLDKSWVKNFKPEDYTESLKRAERQTTEAKKFLKNANKVDILLCHQPPYKMLDKVTFKGAPKHWQNKHAGSKTISNYIKKYRPRYVFCGHIHEQKGHALLGKTQIYNLGCAGHKTINIE